MNVLVKGVWLILRIAAKSDAKSGYITQGFQYCVFTYVNKERIMTTHQAMSAETMIQSGSIPGRITPCVYPQSMGYEDSEIQRCQKLRAVLSSGNYASSQ